MARRAGKRTDRPDAGRLKPRLKRWTLIAAALFGAALVAAAAPIAAIEAGCGRGAQPPESKPPLVADDGYRRAGGDSFLTYPEWYIVHAYADLAGVTARSSESAFDYAGSVSGFWTSLCRATAVARGMGPTTLDQRITNYVIGLSFTLEMAVQGLYERTIGALTVWSRGPERTPEDAINLRFLQAYAAFLEQTPWYRYPFGDELGRLWGEPWSGRSALRSAERRAALSLEYGFKALYAKAMGALAGYAPADLTMMSVVAGGRAGDAPGVEVLRELGEGQSLVRTPRYAAFTDILKIWARNGTAVAEIAGNRRILVTVIAPNGTSFEDADSRTVFALPIQSRPGWARTGYDVPVERLTALIAAIEAQGAAFEHAYDY